MENLYPPSPPSPKKNQGWENCTVWLLRGFMLDLAGMGVGGWGFFILSKIEDSSEAEVTQSFLSDEVVYFCHDKYMLQLIFYLR